MYRTKIHRRSNHATVSARIIKPLHKKFKTYCEEHKISGADVICKLITELLRRENEGSKN